METTEVNKLKYYQHKIDYAHSKLKINKCEPTFVFICIIIVLTFTYITVGLFI